MQIRFQERLLQEYKFDHYFCLTSFEEKIIFVGSHLGNRNLQCDGKHLKYKKSKTLSPENIISYPNCIYKTKIDKDMTLWNLNVLVPVSLPLSLTVSLPLSLTVSLTFWLKQLIRENPCCGKIFWQTFSYFCKYLFG